MTEKQKKPRQFSETQLNRMKVMKIPSSEEIPVELCEPSDIARAVYTARRLVAQAGFCETDQFLIATAVSELATNVIRYAGKGEVVLKIVREEHRQGIQVIAQDTGPGIANVDDALRENFSSGKSLGLGLPSVQKIMDEFTIQSRPRHGTKIIATKWR
jgi:serine/threonine-protein kinase RsbT